MIGALDGVLGARLQRHQQTVELALDLGLVGRLVLLPSELAEIHAEAGALATAVASKILGREITVADQQQLVQESLAEMKG